MFLFSDKILSANNSYKYVTDYNKTRKLLSAFKSTFSLFTGVIDETELLLLKSARYKENFVSPFICDFGGTPVLPEKIKQNNI